MHTADKSKRQSVIEICAVMETQKQLEMDIYEEYRIINWCFWSEKYVEVVLATLCIPTINSVMMLNYISMKISYTLRNSHLNFRRNYTDQRQGTCTAEESLWSERINGSVSSPGNTNRWAVQNYKLYLFNIMQCFSIS